MKLTTTTALRQSSDVTTNKNQISRSQYSSKENQNTPTEKRNVSDVFGRNTQKLRRHFSAQQLTSHVRRLLIRSALDHRSSIFVTRQSVFFLTATSISNQPGYSCGNNSPKFIHTLSRHALIFPDCGNGNVFLSTNGIVQGPGINLLFVSFRRKGHLQIGKVTSVTRRSRLLRSCPRTRLVIHITIHRMFPGYPECVRHVRRIRNSTFIPHRKHIAPIPT